MLKINDYVIYCNKLNNDRTFVIISDIHINKHISKSKLLGILDIVVELNPDYILIPGDLYDIDSSTIGFNSSNYVNLFIKYLTDIAPVYYIQGNTEQTCDLLPIDFKKLQNEDFKFLCQYSKHSIKNGIGTFNNFSCDEDVSISGINLSPCFYNLEEDQKLSFLLYKYQNYLMKLANNNFDKMKILLCHDPIIKDALDILNLDIDLVVSGHNHGGIIPRFLKPLLEKAKLNTELLYPTYTDGMLSCGKGKILVSKGVTKYHPEFKCLESLEMFHTGNIECVKVYKNKDKIL